MPVQPPDPADGQCDPCTAADPGQRLARNTPVDDGRDYGLYLAWFGPGVTKVGLTAAARGTDRLAEQGALAFTWLAHGRLPAVRAAEQHISASGLAPERRHRRAKLAAWWALPDETQRHNELRAAYQRIAQTVPWPAGLDRETCAVIDHVELFSLGTPPDPCHEITELSSDAVLCGTVRSVVGRELLLDTPDGPLLVDTRLLAGWPLYPPPRRPPACNYAPATTPGATMPLTTPPCSDPGRYPRLALRTGLRLQHRRHRQR